MRARIGRWIFLAIAIPVTAALLGKMADRVERTRGADSKMARGLRFGKQALRPSA